MWYMAYSDQQTKDDAVKNAKNDVAKMRESAVDSERLVRFYRLYLGVGDGDDKNTIETEAKADDKLAAELKRINEAMVKNLEAGDYTKLPKDLQFWPLGTDNSVKSIPHPTDPSGPKSVPPKGLIYHLGDLRGKEVAYKATDKATESYNAQIDAIKVRISELEVKKKLYETEIAKIAPDFDKEIKKITSEFDKRTKLYQAAEANANKRITELTDERDRFERANRQLKEAVEVLQKDVLALNAKATKGERETFTFEEPQGKILRKLKDGVVEINIGSAVNVRPGLTFTVLPPDYPEKGRASRMRTLRIPDARGEYKPVEQFVPKGSIEVYEVVNANLSLARIVPGSELDPIRDGITASDLLYNSAWRKGVADHIALIGIFDINGDGTDDIASVIRDLDKMGIPIDAYYDMKKRQWVGQITERTRYVVEGFYPLSSATDPNREEKTKLLNAMTAGVNEAKQKGVATVNFRDFFSRMGYKFRFDVTDDKINQ